MIKFIHCADIHLGKIQNNLDQRFEDFGTAFRHVVEEALNREIDFLLIAGDLFDKRNINARTLEQAVEILELLKNRQIPVIAIEGNHDKAFLRDKDSWMSFLANRGYIILLKPEFEGGKLLVNPYNVEGGTGCYIDIDQNIRVYGLGYLGRAAGSKLAELVPHLSEEKTNILLLHAMVGRMGGELIGSIPKGDVACLKERIVYLALGHGHNRYMVDKLVQIPSIDEKVGNSDPYSKEVIAEINSVTEKVQINLFEYLSAEGAATQEQVIEEIEESYIELQQLDLDQIEEEEVFADVEDYSQYWGHNPGSLEHCRIDEANYNQGFYYVEIKDKQITKVEHVESQKRPARIISIDITGITTPEEVYVKIVTEVEGQLKGLVQPLLRLLIKGEIGFDILEIDEAEIRQQIHQVCEPLILEIDLRANLPQFTHSTNAELLDRQAIEREVLRKKVDDRSQWRHLGEDLVDLILEVKEDVLGGMPPEEILAKVLGMVGDEDEDS